MGITECGIRLDSGDMAYLTRKARKMLDEAGWTELPDLRVQLPGRVPDPGPAAPGRPDRPLRRGRAADHRPQRAGVRRRVQAGRRGGRGRATSSPRSRSAKTWARSPTPTSKRSTACSASDTGKAIADYLCVHDETVDETKHLQHLRPRGHLEDEGRLRTSRPRPLQVPIFRKGELVYQQPISGGDPRPTALQQVDTLWDEVKRFDNPHTYYVDLSKRLWDIKHQTCWRRTAYN